MSDVPTPQSSPHPLEIILELIRRARRAETVVALRFIAVNDTHLLVPFQQSALWLTGSGIETLSGLVEVDANVPYVRWLNRLCATLSGSPARAITSADVPPDLAADWQEWLPANVAWVPFPGAANGDGSGGLLFARDLPWREIEIRLLVEWLDTWGCVHGATQKPTVRTRLRRFWNRLPGAIGRRPVGVGALAVAVLLVPVRISVLAPGELVPAHPVSVRAPLDGVIKAFHVQTNDPVKTGQPLFSYDEAMMASRLEVAVEAQRTAEAEQRQFTQQALYDTKARGALAGSRGAVEEKRIETEFLRGQLERNKVVSPCDGVAFVDDPTEWIGRPVVAGQRIMRVADPADKEIEAWLPVADAIVLPTAAPAKLYLDASPLAPVAGRVRSVSYEALRRPDGHYAYRVRANLVGATDHRVGLKGTVRLSGGRVPLVYWMLRRPLASLRELVGM
jgi:hypothetical protein